MLCNHSENITGSELSLNIMGHTNIIPPRQIMPAVELSTNYTTLLTISHLPKYKYRWRTSRKN